MIETLFTTLVSLVAVVQEGRVSEFGRYEGWSEPLFDEWVSSSRYVEMRDGVRLAVDVTLPALDGEALEGPFPVVWTHSRYHRRNGVAVGGRVPTSVDVQEHLQRLVRHGYAVAAVAVRGSGASFGRSNGLFNDEETKDAVEIIAWLAAQPWCDGNVGMHGGSYLGMTQYMAASESPPALKAIFPEVAGFDMYDLMYPGGVFRRPMIAHWAALTIQLDNEDLAPPVDADPEGVLLAEAVAQHADNWNVVEGYSAAPFRDDVAEPLDWSSHGPSSRVAGVNAARIPIYHYNGWYDVFVLGTTLWYANYDGPQHMTIGPWAHAGMPYPAVNAERMRILSIEQHRWFDRWLKGIENGIEDEAPIHYALIVEPGVWEWIPAWEWPVPEAEPMRMHFAPGPSGSVASANDGLLLVEAPAEASRDLYAVDPSTSTGPRSRWMNAVGATAVMVYEDLADNDRRCLTYTTPPLEEELMVVGHPVVRLFVASSTGDADLHVLLEEVADDGVRYVTEGVLRASHRKLGEAPYDNLGLPWQRSNEEDAEPVPADTPVEVLMDLHPTATLFDAGHRLRVTIMGADADNTQTGPRAAETELRVFLGGEAGSSIELPVLR